MPPPSSAERLRLQRVRREHAAASAAARAAPQAKLNFLAALSAPPAAAPPAAAPPAAAPPAAAHTHREISRIAKAAALEAKIKEMSKFQGQLIARHEKGTLQRTDEAYLRNTLKKLQDHSKARRTLHGELVGMVQVMVGKGESFKLGEKANLQKALNLNTEAEAVSKQAEGFVQAALDYVLKTRSPLCLFEDPDLLGHGLKMLKSRTEAPLKVPVKVELEDQTILRLVGERDRIALMIRLKALLAVPKEEAAKNLVRIYVYFRKDKSAFPKKIDEEKAKFVELVTSIARAEIESFSGKENAAKRKAVIKTHTKAVRKQVAFTAGSVALGAGVVATAAGPGLLLAIAVLAKSVMQGVELVARECMSIKKLDETLVNAFQDVKKKYGEVTTVWLKEAGIQTLANVVAIPQTITGLFGGAFETVKHLGTLMETYEAKVAKASEGYRKLVKDLEKLLARLPKSGGKLGRELPRGEQELRDLVRRLGAEIRKVAEATAGFDALIKERKRTYGELTAIRGVKDAAKAAAVLTVVANMAIAGAGIGLLHFDYMDGAKGALKKSMAIAEAACITPATAVDGLANMSEYKEALHLTGQAHHGGQGGHH